MPSSRSVLIGLVTTVAILSFPLATTALAQWPAATVQAPLPKGPPLAPAKMRPYCRYEASKMFGVSFWRTNLGAVKKAADGGFSIYGKADQGVNGKKPFRCLFTGKREFVAVVSLAYESEP